MRHPVVLLFCTFGWLGLSASAALADANNALAAPGSSPAASRHKPTDLSHCQGTHCQKVQVQGHRGARARFPENSQPAFAYALGLGVDVLELDLQVSKDGQLVISHDAKIDPKRCRHKDGRRLKKPWIIFQRELSELKKLDCGSLRNRRFPLQKRIPGTPLITLDELLTWLQGSAAGRKVGLNIEAKFVPRDLGQRYPQPKVFAALIVQSLQRHKAIDRSVIQSFDQRMLLAVRDADPHLRRALLSSDNRPDYVAATRAAGAQIASPNQDWLDADDVQALHDAGLQVVPWTADSPQDWQRLVDMQVDAIISDDPEALLDWLGRGAEGDKR